ncbi:MAG TPA: HAD family hydrolase [Thermoanaerobaculia bacterium]|nr:HAD family hydrolase [Thermoanaerobaculia bacterium]
MRAILFDVDGTLLSCGRQVRRLFAGALEEVYGTAGELDGYDFSGKTDPRIVLDLMAAAGWEREAVLARLPAMRERYLARLEAGLEASEMRLMPAVEEVLAEVQGSGRATVGLLTGNWRQGAEVKLSRLGLGGRFPFGAFGDDGEDRDCLPPVALARAAAFTGRPCAPGEALIVGDSLLDVACGRAHRVPVLAVATGWTAGERLAAAGADWVVSDLREALPLLRQLVA